MYDLEKSNGPLAEVNSHDIDTLRWFTGSEFETVYAMGDNYRCPDAKAEFPDADEMWMVGDSYEADYVGAERAGMKAILVRREHEGAARYCEGLECVVETILGRRA